MYSDLCQRKTWVWEHLHLFSIIPRICCRMYVIHLVIQEITFVANSLPIRNFIEFVSHAVASYEVWKDGDLWCPSCCTILQWGLRSGRHWHSLDSLGFLLATVEGVPLVTGHSWGAQDFARILLQSIFTAGVQMLPWELCVKLLVCFMLPSLKPGPTFQTIFLFGLRRYSSPEKEKLYQTIPPYFLLENEYIILPRGAAKDLYGV